MSSPWKLWECGGGYPSLPAEAKKLWESHLVNHRKEGALSAGKWGDPEHKAYIGFWI